MQKFDNELLNDFASRYWEIIRFGELKGLNLISYQNYEEFLLKQVYDSVTPVLLIDEFKSLLSESTTVLDIGTGGGFPLLPLAILNKEKKFIGLDSKKKKVDAIRIISKKLGLTNIELIHSRIEDYDLSVKNLLIVTKAVGSVKDILKKIKVKNNFNIVFYKGPNLEELEDLVLGENSNQKYNMLFNKMYQLEGTNGRVLLAYRVEK